MKTREETIFNEALDKHDPQERSDFLDRACTADVGLRRRIESLLSAYDAGQFLEAPAPGLNATMVASPVAESPGAEIGPYRLLEQIGEGGMGVVYVAEQTEPIRRKVAIKIIKPGMDSRQVIARFEAERQALAMMDHPNISKVLDAGTTDAGRPYFVMDLVRGMLITEYCDKAKLTPRYRLELFMTVCQAVQHAHQKGIIHRDLKPSNVLVTLHDGEPVAKVIDFGVAKAIHEQLTKRTLYTAFSQMIGTPLYMSPEQAEMSGLDVDTRSDIYSLGVLLYELLTGQTPFDGDTLRKAGLDEMRRMFREDEPLRPSQRVSTLNAQAVSTLSQQRGLDERRLGQTLRGELDWMVMKALEKDRDRRYESASAFAADVRRYLDDLPVHASPPSAVYRLRKFARRNKAALFAASAVTVALLLGLSAVAGSIGWLARDRAALRAQTEERVNEALREAAFSQRQTLWPEALAAARRAEAIMGDSGDNPALRKQVREMLTDLTMIATLEDVRLLKAESNDTGGFDLRQADLAYARAFREYGIDVEALSIAEAAERVRLRPIAVELAAALDDWAITRKNQNVGAKYLDLMTNRYLRIGMRPVDQEAGGKNWERILSVARAADIGDEWRNRLREAVQQQDQEALQHLATSAPVDDVPKTTLALLGYSLGEAGAREEAVAVLSKAQRRHPGDFWINFNLAAQQRNLQPPRLDEAVRYYTVATALRPESAPVHSALGNVLREKGLVDEAIDAYREAVRLMPDYAGAHSSLGFTLAAQGRLDEAIRAVREAVRLQPDNSIYHNNLGGVLTEKGLFDEAIDACREAIRLQPDHPGAHTNLGIALNWKGCLDESIDAFREAIRIQSDYAPAHNGLGNVLMAQGRLDEAITAYNEAIRLKPDHALAYNGLGVSLNKKGLLNDAVAAFREAVRLKPDYATCYGNLAMALDSLGRSDESIAACREAICLQPDSAVRHRTLGNLLDRQGRLDEAIAALREAIRLQPDDASGHYNFAHKLNRDGQRDEAITAYREAIRLKPDFAQAHCNLGGLLMQSGQYAEALACFRRGHDLGSRDPTWPYPSAQWVEEAERCADIEPRLPALLRGDSAPSNGPEAIAVAQICKHQKLYARSAQFYEGALANYPELADETARDHSYDAACAAVRAGCEAADELDELQRGNLLHQALQWLRTCLERQAKQLEDDKPESGRQVQAKLNHWLRDSDLAGVRDADALARLPEAEQAPWQRFWADVRSVLDKTAAKVRPTKTP